MQQTNSYSRLHYSRIQDHNKYPQTDVLYDPLRRILLHPEELTVSKGILNPAATHSRVTRDFAYLSETEVKDLRQKTLIPIDQPLVPTYDLEKVRNNKFIVVDAKEAVIGAPISAEQMQRIRSQGLKQQRIVYDFVVQQPVRPVRVKPPPIRQTKIIKQQLKTTYAPPAIQEYHTKQSDKTKNKYKYNLFSMLDEPANGAGCGCSGNQVIASRKQPQSLNWLN